MWVVGDLYQLLSVNATVHAYAFDFTQQKTYIATNLWRLFKLVQLNEVMCQRHWLFLEMLNKSWIKLVDDSTEKLLK